MSNTPYAGPVSNQLALRDAPRVRQLLGVLTFAIITAISARISLMLPTTTIPFSFQPLAVIVAGGLLGARLGAASQIVYLLAGMSGLPVFVLGSILAPSGGYLMAYPFAAFVVGLIAEGSVQRRLAGLLAGLAVIYAGGVAWLSLTVGLETAILNGVMPFILSDLVKVALALVILQVMQNRSRDLFGA
jgi:biotin transport system substrate-specific component